MNSREQLGKQIRICKNCELWKTCNGPVTGRGSLFAKIMFVGEAPGAKEDRQCLPFVGRSGKFLDRVIKESGLTNEKIYITNIVKCRPPENRNPKIYEINACLPHLANQINLIKPKMIVSLGMFSSSCLLPFPYNKKPITQTRGKTFGNSEYNCLVCPVYHPAATFYDVSKRDIFEKDIGLIKELLDKQNKLCI